MKKVEAVLIKLSKHKRIRYDQLGSLISVICSHAYNLRALFNRGTPCQIRFLIFSELYELGKKIWREDPNRVSAGSEYLLNLQSNSGTDGSDSAPQPLFSRVDSSVFQMPTIKGIS